MGIKVSSSYILLEETRIDRPRKSFFIGRKWFDDLHSALVLARNMKEGDLITLPWIGTEDPEPSGPMYEDARGLEV